MISLPSAKTAPSRALAAQKGVSMLKPGFTLPRGRTLNNAYLQRRVQELEEKARTALKEFGEHCRSPYFSFSGGKDSLVATDIGLKILPHARVLYRECGASLPGTYELFAEIETRWGKEIEINVSDKTIFDVFGQYGLEHPRIERYTHRALITESMEKWLRQNPEVDGYITGLRAEESRSREILGKSRGQFYKKRDGMWTCNPLMWWKISEVWAYVDCHELPYHPAYEVGHHHAREDLRLGVWAGESNIQWGRWMWLKYYYPDLFAEFAARFPQVRQYV